MSEIVETLVRELARGCEDAWSGLVELDHSYVPELIQAFWASRDLSLRISLLRVIWEHRMPDTLPFFVQAFHEDDPEIWKAALDGFFVMNPIQAIQALQSEQNHYGHDPASQQGSTRMA